MDRIVLIANTSWYLYNFRSRLISQLVDQGYHVYCLAPRDDYSTRLCELGANYVAYGITQRGRNPFREMLAVFSLFLHLRRIQPKFVLSFTVKCNLYAGLCRHLLAFDQIANISGLGECFDRAGPLNAVVRWLYRIALKNCSVVFFQNKDDYEMLTASRLVSPDASHVLPGSGVDVQQYSPVNRKPAAKRTFLMFGRLTPKKGYGLFLKVAENLKSSGEDGIEFWVMGVKDSSRKESAALLEQLQEAARRGVIRLLPATDRVVDVLREVDVVVLPSVYNEGVPRTLLEAMACGIPLITTDWKGCRDTVDDGRNGYLVEPESEDSLEENILKFANLPSAQLRKMGDRSRQKAEREFDEGLVLQSYFDAIKAA